jgi:hypothetical protein
MNISDMARKIALGWLVLGLIGLSGVVIISISHYIFGAPIHEAHSGGRLATQAEVTRNLAMFAGGSFMFAALGGGVFFRLKKS